MHVHVLRHNKQVVKKTNEKYTKIYLTYLRTKILRRTERGAEI